MSDCGSCGTELAPGEGEWGPDCDRCMRLWLAERGRGRQRLTPFEARRAEFGDDLPVPLWVLP